MRVLICSSPDGRCRRLALDFIHIHLRLCDRPKVRKVILYQELRVRRVDITDIIFLLLCMRDKNGISDSAKNAFVDMLESVNESVNFAAVFVIREYTKSCFQLYPVL